MLHMAVLVTAVFAQAWERIAQLFYSKTEVAKRASGRFETLKRKEMEMERLDRLRHPSDYQGR